ncbi:hypothetical protein RDI58_026921 [Solanum bulbocastanum]|uniref:Uncharacterized protein n=1 Tax=Solanum bulbocastanum TaxID=147425 RepID=A0AAN8SWS8_SOLBU
MPWLGNEGCLKLGLATANHDHEGLHDSWWPPHAMVPPVVIMEVCPRKRSKIEVKDKSPLPPVVGPLESFTSELRVLKEFVEKLPQGLGESYMGPRSYVPQIDFDAYLVDQRKQKAQLSNLEKAYASLV